MYHKRVRYVCCIWINTILVPEQKVLSGICYKIMNILYSFTYVSSGGCKQNSIEVNKERSVYMYVRIRCINEHTYVGMSVSVCVCVYACLYAYVCAYIHICTYMCVCRCTHKEG